MTPITLTGYLGRDREIRTTHQRTYTARYYDQVTEGWTESEITLATREYALLSVATREGRKTTWHRVICWNVERPGTSGVKLARRGDKVKITGRKEIFTWTDDSGEEQEIEQLILQDFQLIQPKPRMEVA